MSTKPPLRNITEAALWLDIPKKTLQNLVSARKVPFTRPGNTRHVRFAQEHLDAIVAAGEVPVGRRPATHPPAGPSTPPPPSGPRVTHGRAA
jgi:excisionase family DNA binding protein